MAGPVGTSVGHRSGVVFGPSGGDDDSAASPHPPTSTAPAGAQPLSDRSTPNQEHISQLVALGFDRDAAISALRATGGDVEYAASVLFNFLPERQ